MDFGWNVSKVTDHEAVCYGVAEETVPWLGLVKGERGPRPITHAMALASIFVGMPEITEENHHEFFARLRFRESAFDTLMSRGGIPRFIKLDEVAAFIGMTTNAFGLGLDEWLMLWAPPLVRAMTWKADVLPNRAPSNEGPDRVEYEAFKMLAAEGMSRRNRDDSTHS